MADQTLTLLKNFTFVGANLDVFHTDWVRFPAEFLHVEMTVEVKSRIGLSSVSVWLETTFDMDLPYPVGASIPADAPGTTTTALPSPVLGPWVRLRLQANATSQTIFSVWLQPKSD